MKHKQTDTQQHNERRSKVNGANNRKKIYIRLAEGGGWGSRERSGERRKKKREESEARKTLWGRQAEVWKQVGRANRKVYKWKEIETDCCSTVRLCVSCRQHDKQPVVQKKKNPKRTRGQHKWMLNSTGRSRLPHRPTPPGNERRVLATLAEPSKKGFS